MNKTLAGLLLGGALVVSANNWYPAGARLAENALLRVQARSAHARQAAADDQLLPVDARTAGIDDQVLPVDARLAQVEVSNQTGDDTSNETVPPEVNDTNS